MKKFKSILCMALMLVVGCIAFVGCGPKEEDNPPPAIETTITLAEAKTTIINALKIDEQQVQAMAMTYGNEQQSNRSILLKFGKIDFNVEASVTYYEDNKVIEIPSRLVADYTGGNWNEYVLDCLSLSDDPNKDTEDAKVYNDGENLYYNINGEKLSGNMVFMNPLNIFVQSYCDMVETLFTDEAFTTMYNGNVTKTSIDNGYTFTMPISNTYQGVNVIVYFDNHNMITKVEMSMEYEIPDPEQEIVTMGKSYGKMTVIKYNQEITAPNWFDINDYQN